MSNWSRESVKEALYFWQPKYDQPGVKLSKIEGHNTN